jgi:RNA polymerase sigma factor (sigma-70 family)
VRSERLLDDPRFRNDSPDLTMDESALRNVVRAAAAGDEAAWNELVERFQGLVWATARSFRLSRADAADVAQTTWLRLVENLDRIREPERLGAWLATTARRESLRHLRLHGRELVSDETDVFEAPADDPLEVALLTEERDAALWRAFARLSERCQTLLRLLVSQDEPSYEAIGAALGMPIGAIGPTRMRCLDKLRAYVGTNAAVHGGTA